MSENQRNTSKGSSHLVFDTLSERVRRNNLKAFCLEEPTHEILEDMGIDFQDTTHIFNFKNKSEDGIPDFIVNEYIAIELKNWNCEKYTIDFRKALREIVYRFLNHWDKRKILIITNPKWCRRVKEWLFALGIEVYEVGEFITSDIFNEYSGKGRRLYNSLKNIIRTVLGYVYSVFRSFDHCSLYGNVLSDMTSRSVNTCRKKLEHCNSTVKVQLMSGYHRSQNDETRFHSTLEKHIKYSYRILRRIVSLISKKTKMSNLLTLLLKHIGFTKPGFMFSYVSFKSHTLRDNKTLHTSVHCFVFGGTHIDYAWNTREQRV